IGRDMPPRTGLERWSVGMLVFGSSFVARLVGGAEAATAWSLATDACVIVSTLLFISGLREFIGVDPLTRRTGLATLAACLAVEATAIAFAGHVGRFATIDIVLGFIYGALVGHAFTAPRRIEPALFVPMRVLAVTMGLLALLTLGRGLYIARHGMWAVDSGRFTQVYYAYASLCAVLLPMCLMWLLFVRLNGQLADLATRDALTRVLNRNGLNEALQRHFGSRAAPPMTLLAVDIDHFKRINDGWGHASGDLVLRAVADALARNVRPADLVARTGGEEFVVCSPAIDPAQALALAERLRAAVEALRPPLTDGRTRAQCTVSIGIAAPFAALETWPDAAAAADRALYAAKEAGRNRVVVA
ncbi:MAG: GGDEF domain-containing protein, partial [Burkholderiales bacterium]|nr:GGDEF domain-containing protein [Burkholderiales bacterium]